MNYQYFRPILLLKKIAFLSHCLVANILKHWFNMKPHFSNDLFSHKPWSVLLLASTLGVAFMQVWLIVRYIALSLLYYLLEPTEQLGISSRKTTFLIFTGWKRTYTVRPTYSAHPGECRYRRFIDLVVDVVVVVVNKRRWTRWTRWTGNGNTRVESRFLPRIREVPFHERHSSSPSLLRFAHTLYIVCVSAWSILNEWNAFAISRKSWIPITLGKTIVPNRVRLPCGTMQYMIKQKNCNFYRRAALVIAYSWHGSHKK